MSEPLRLIVSCAPEHADCAHPEIFRDAIIDTLGAAGWMDVETFEVDIAPSLAGGDS